MLLRSKKIVIPANSEWQEELPEGQGLSHITYQQEAEGLISLESEPSQITDIRYRIKNNGPTYERKITLWICKT